MWQKTGPRTIDPWPRAAQQGCTISGGKQASHEGAGLRPATQGFSKKTLHCCLLWKLRECCKNRSWTPPRHTNDPEGRSRHWSARAPLRASQGRPRHLPASRRFPGDSSSTSESPHVLRDLFLGCRRVSNLGRTTDKKVLVPS